MQRVVLSQWGHGRVVTTPHAAPTTAPQTSTIHLGDEVSTLTSTQLIVVPRLRDERRPLHTTPLGKYGGEVGTTKNESFFVGY